MRKYQPKPPWHLAPLLPRIQPHSSLQYPPRQLLFSLRIIPAMPFRQEISRQIHPQEIPRVAAFPIRDPGCVEQVRDGNIVLTQPRTRKSQQLVHELHVLEDLRADMAARARGRMQQGDGFEGPLYLRARGDERSQVQACGAEVFREPVFDVEEARVDRFWAGRAGAGGAWEGGRGRGAGESGGVHGEQGCEGRGGGVAWVCSRDGEDGEGVDLVAYEVDVVGGAEAHEGFERGFGVADACLRNVKALDWSLRGGGGEIYRMGCAGLRSARRGL